MVVQDIRAADAEELRWLRTGWLRHLRERTSTYSVVTAGLVLMFASLGMFELFEDDISLFEVLLSWAILLAGLGVATIVILGIELPMWVGFALVVAHAAVNMYYLGFSDERQNAIAALQELPLMAMYFAWFYGARIARTGEVIILVVLAIAALGGQFAGATPEGIRPLFGPANLVGAALLTWMCLEAGLFVRHRIRLESHTDELTGALNRRGFLAKAGMEFRRAVRYDRPLTLVVLDLDKFKAINDEAGHAAGDDALKSVTAQWMSLSRPTDIVGRLGGDEFALLLPETDAEAARTMLRRMRMHARHPWSWGIAQMTPGESVEATLDRADRAMYDDKRR